MLTTWSVFQKVASRTCKAALHISFMQNEIPENIVMPLEKENTPQIAVESKMVIYKNT